jgi:glycosyltransferase involved in cell wall biosynthesis
MYLASAGFVAGHSGYDGRDDLVVANSRWTADVLRSRRGMNIDRVIYPPVVGSASQVPWEGREAGFTILGRVSPEKRIDRVIDIIGRVRACGHDVHLHIIGPIGTDAYGALVRRKVDQNAAWCFGDGAKAGAEKMNMLAKHRYAIHGRDGEAFGIAVAEQVLAGCIPFVPDSGGPPEIVGHADLCYRDEDEAVAKITAVLQSEARQQSLREHLSQQAGRFATETFMREFRAMVADFVELRGIRDSAHGK